MATADFTHAIEVNGPQDMRYLGQRLEWLRSRLHELESFKRVVAPFSGVVTARGAPAIVAVSWKQLRRCASTKCRRVMPVSYQLARAGTRVRLRLLQSDAQSA